MTHVQATHPPIAWRQCAHDIKNVMATVSMVAEELAGEVSPRSRKLGQRLERSCVRVLEMCAAPAHGDAETKLYPIIGVLEDVADLARGLSAQPLSVTLEADKVTLDEKTNAAVFRVLANLATNSVQAFDGCMGELEICARRKSEKVIITHSDNGHGLSAVSPKNEAPRLPKRTGMGLTIARALVAQIGGSLIVQSTGPGGTVFCVEFPHGRKHN
ncbi:MAG: HAMP domain-containing sensor histidine kinase [Pseudomonadota bacterium]